MATRIEKDFLGEKELPDTAYYGVQTLRGKENFHITGVPMSLEPNFVKAFGYVKKAAAMANRDLGALDAKVADAIIQGCDRLISGEMNDQFVTDFIQGGAGTSTNMNANEVIANLALESLGFSKGEYQHVSPNDHVNYGQSTNDIFPTAMRLATLLELEPLYAALDRLTVSLEKKGHEFYDILKSGRTHLMDAVPIRLGQEFTAYGGAIRRAQRSIQEQAELLREVGLGGSAVGTGINTHPDYRERAIANLSRISGQTLKPVDDMRYAMQSNLAMSSVSSALRNLALEVIRISNDLRLLSSGPNTGLAEINLPALQPGSSIMPGKINPVMAELAAMVSFQVIGYDTAVALAVQAGQLELNVMMPTMAHSVLTSITIITNTLHQLTEFCIKGITANRKRCEFYAQSTVSLATALNPYIGYAKAAEIAKESVATGRTIIDIARSKGYLSEEQIREILDPTHMTEPQRPLKISQKPERS